MVNGRKIVLSILKKKHFYFGGKCGIVTLVKHCKNCTVEEKENIPTESPDQNPLSVRVGTFFSIFQNMI